MWRRPDGALAARRTPVCECLGGVDRFLDSLTAVDDHGVSDDEGGRV
jgi:hypothetical protein